MAVTTVWGSRTVPGEGEFAPSIGPLSLRFRWQGGELRVALQGRTAAGEGGAEWTRWALPPEERPPLVHLSPLLPDRVVVVKPASPFHLAPGGSARIFIRIPISVRVRLHAPDGPILHDFPTGVLSESWWGGHLDGEPAYWLPTSARTEIHEALLQPHFAICPTILANGASLPLGIERFALRVRHLTLFGAGNAVWSDETVIRWQGISEDSHLEIAGSPPPEAEGGVRLTPPRTAPPRGLRARAIARIREWGGDG